MGDKRHFPIVYVNNEQPGGATVLEFEEDGDELVARIHERFRGDDTPEVRIKSRRDAAIIVSGLLEWIDKFN